MAVERIVQFGLAGVPGPPGETGPTGPAGSSSLGPSVAGVATLDPLVMRINSYNSAQSIGSNVASTGGAAIIVDHLLGNQSSKVVIQCLARATATSKIQTLDAARRIKYLASVWTLFTSGTDIADDTDVVGCVFAITLVTVGATKVLRITGTVAAGYLLAATVNEVW